MDYQLIVRRAIAAKQKSYSPFSKFRVGAALLASSGEIFSGCNIENSSLGLTICAERTAIFKGYSEGVRKFKAIAIASDSPTPIPPCGACRQVLQDLAPGITVILVGKDGKRTMYPLSRLLPRPFSAAFLRKRK